MSDSEQGGASAAFPGPSATTLAALTTILLATGSALLLRTKLSTPSTTSPHLVSAGSVGESADDTLGSAGPSTVATNETKDNKMPRSKERRRRGKDPVKEIMKGGKRGNKILLKLSKAATDIHIVGELAHGPSSAESETHPDLNEVETLSATPGRSQDVSLAHARSSSSVSASSYSGSAHFGGRPLDDYSTTPQDVTDPSDHESETSRPDGIFQAPSCSVSSVSRDDDAATQPTASISIVQMGTHSPKIAPTSPTSAADSSTPSISTPTPFSFPASAPQSKASGGGAQEHAQVIQTLPSPPSLEPNVYRKPPRFSMHSPPMASGSGLSPPSLNMASLSLPIHQGSLHSQPSPSCSPPSSLSSLSMASSSSMVNTDDEALPIMFPTLNTQPPPNATSNPQLAQLPSSSISSPKPSPKLPTSEYPYGNGITGPGSANNDSGSGGAAGQVGASRNTRQGHAPRRTPTPSSQSGGTHTPPPSLSAQTQIASLRGALEAARLREDKLRLEMEKRSKDLEALRWESLSWRQREAELQNQILHLSHHLQAYSAFHASMSPQAHPPTLPIHPLQHPGVNNKSQHYRVSNTPSPAPSPTRHHATPQVNGMSPMPSPLSQTTPHSHMFPYSATPSPSTPGHNIPVNYLQSPPAPPSSLFSVLFPYAGNQPAGPSSSSRSGSSSVGSVSPDIGGSTSPPLPLGLNRDRQRSRFWNGGEMDDWIETGNSSQHTPKDGASPADEEVNSLLADAILKRPESIRRGASQQSVEGKTSQGVRGEEEESSTEFTFPSLSDFGQGMRTSRTGTQNPDGGSLDSLSHGDDDTSESPPSDTEAESNVPTRDEGEGTESLDESVEFIEEKTLTQAADADQPAEC